MISHPVGGYSRASKCYDFIIVFATSNMGLLVTGHHKSNGLPFAMVFHH